MDAIATLAFELQPTAPALASAGSAGSAHAAVFDVSHFNAAFAAAANNGRAESLGSKALEMQHGEFRPSDMLMMTLKAQEFLFHCELTSNVANRTSDGVQQLFREQS